MNQETENNIRFYKNVYKKQEIEEVYIKMHLKKSINRHLSSHISL
jgi:hypothetical protein